MIVDAHVHVWSAQVSRFPYAPGFSPADFWLPAHTPDDYRRVSDTLGESVRINLVQMTWYGLDHGYIVDLIESDPQTYVGTGIVPAVSDVSLGRPDRAMRDLAARGVRAFRIRGRGAQPQFGQPERWLDQEGYERMFAAGAEHGLPLSFLIGPADLPELDRMCARFPETPVVVDHVGGVRVRDGAVDAQGLRCLLALARHPRVYVKLGPVHGLGDRHAPFADVVPLLRAVIAGFGADRCMWESDSGGPILMQDPARDYPACLDTIRGADFLTAQEKEQILGATALQLLWPR